MVFNPGGTVCHAKSEGLVAVEKKKEGVALITFDSEVSCLIGRYRGTNSRDDHTHSAHRSAGIDIHYSTADLDDRIILSRGPAQGQKQYKRY